INYIKYKSKKYKKFKPYSQTQYIVSRYPNKWNSYKKGNFKNILQTYKKFKLLYGNLSKKKIKNLILKVTNQLKKQITTMKTDIKALPLSLALSFLAFLGACSSVNSTPDTDVPTSDNSVILENTEEGQEVIEGLSPEAVTEETAEMETTDGMTEDSAVDTEATDIESAEEINPTEIILPESDSAEVETDSEAAENLVPEAQPEQ
ncbi:MAG: hypothetical protein HC784_16605, partial [Hydrococcus sp. CSU_1_8]|nr:hypothetical protein [Hydrococcus sp. CSU_1_8]